MALGMFWLSTVLACSIVTFVAANLDPANGYLLNYGLTASWVAKHQPLNITTEIQLSECAQNTRLHYPKVQLFAMFKVNHHCDDAYHGCPYGACWAYNVTPSAQDVVPDFTNTHLFFWHDTGGVRGTHWRPISDPNSGANGFEENLTGKFHVGDPNSREAHLNRNHDGDYPKFNSSALKRWTPEERHQFQAYQESQPLQAKCGLPCEENRDPGSTNGAYGGYKANAEKDYSPPPGWVPGPADTCYANGGKNPSDPHEGGNGNGQHSKRENHCKDYCQCLNNCKGHGCRSCKQESNKGCWDKQCKKKSSRSKRCI